MPDLQRIGRHGPGPQSFTRRQQRQQKPIGSCLTFQQLKRTDGEPHIQQLDPLAQHGHPAGEPQQFQQQFQLEPQHDHHPAGEPQQFQQHFQLEPQRKHQFEPQHDHDPAGEPWQQHR